MKKQKSGLYRSKVTIGYGLDGKPLYKYISGKTRRELEDARQDVVAHYITKTALHEDVLFGVYTIKWFDVCKRPFVSTATAGQYRTMLNRHILPLLGERNLRAITTTELQQLINRFNGKSRSQINLALSVLHAVFAQALAEHIVPSDPTVALRRPTATPPEERRALTEQEREQILATIHRHPQGALLAVLYYTGMRQGEMRGLQWGDINFDDGYIHIQRDIDSTNHNQPGALKTRAADRIVPLSDPLRAILYPMRGLPTAYIFQGARSGHPIAQSAFYDIWASLMQDAGLATPSGYQYKPGQQHHPRLDYTSDITPHVLRHNFVTMCWEAGMDPGVVQKLVGHSSYQITMDVYTHISNAHLAKANAALEHEFSKVAHKLHKASDI